ncbi:hypothetical protein [Microbispora sp. GKU 823]|uniref:hypothetical protein n=1 Tax=Microbispora sp. GKU 823 TaxID=1652100 RepID=UPI0009A3D2B1|nr:hypothetical protein [Microbispora sp. GKU 823]OPG09845.1 hypothetical protein B1L11_24910 [Microbispora sp. GKU 823]
MASFTEPATGEPVQEPLHEPVHEERPRDERAHDAEADGEGTDDLSVPGPVPPADTDTDTADTADSDDTAHTADAAAAPQGPEAESAPPVGVGTSPGDDTGRENPAHRDAEALEQHRKGRPPRLVRPRVPDEDVAAGRAATEEVASAAAPPAAAPVKAAEAAEVAEVAEVTQDTPTWIRPSHTPQEVPDDAGSGAHSAAHPAREGAHAPGSRPYESATGKGDVTPPPAGPAAVSIRAVPAGPRAVGPAGPARPSLPTPGTTTPGRPAHEEPPRLRRVEAVVGRDTSGGWRRLAQVVVGGSRTDGMEVDEARTRIPLTTSRRIMVLGCTGGAGQTTTALMLGHTLARYRDDRVLALDANTGEDTLTTRIAAESPETLSSLIEGSEEVTGYLGMRAYTTRCESGLEVVGADTDDRVTQRLAERAFLADWRRTLAALDRHYRLTVIDPAAALAARLLPYADQLVLVAPASEDASEAVAMTYEWLDGHGCSDLRRRAVMVINGVSRRSLPDVEQAEAVASGRCRAIVRVPWEDELAPGRPGPVDVNHLRMGGRRAYVALAGVIVSGLAAVQAKQEVAR